MSDDRKKLVRIDIEELIEQTEYGSVHFEVKRHRGNTFGLIINSNKTFKPTTDDPNSEFLAHIMQVMQVAERKEYSGSISFTLVYNKGTIKVLHRGEAEQKQYLGGERKESQQDE